jgi:lysine 2,3-aminomutase
MEKQRVITTREELERYLVLTEDEKQWFAYHGDTLPLLISSYFLGLIDPSDPNDP